MAARLLRGIEAAAYFMENHDILSDSSEVCTVQPWEAVWRLQLTEEKIAYISAHLTF